MLENRMKMLIYIKLSYISETFKSNVSLFVPDICSVHDKSKTEKSYLLRSLLD